MDKNKQKIIDAVVDAVTKEFIQKGLLIEAGFAAFRVTMFHGEAPAEQIAMARLAYFSGAQHLYGTMMNMMDPCEEPTDADMHRMALIDGELNRFIAELTAMGRPVKGSA